MRSAEIAAYGLGRLAFGAGLIGAPRQFGAVLLGDEAEHPTVRISLRVYGTRDLLLGIGALATLARRGNARPWVAAGVAADVLDTAIQLGEWDDMPADKRLLGVLSAVGAAVGGAALLARGLDFNSP